MAEKSKEPQDKNLHFLYTRLILYLIQPLVLTPSLTPHSLYDHSSYRDEHGSKPCHALLGIFMLDAPASIALTISVLKDQLRICWIAHPRLVSLDSMGSAQLQHAEGSKPRQ